MIDFLNSPCSLLDLETTGMSAHADRITEVAVLNWSLGQTPQSWEQLIDPGCGIPEMISQLTGITPGMVSGQPYFEDIAGDLWQRLDDSILVAHNARFDYAFLKAAFRACGYDYKPRIVCTLKLSRALFPEWPRHNLDAICAAIGYPRSSSHRAMADTQAMFAFLCYAIAHRGEAAVNAAAASQFKKPALPIYLDQAEIDAIPDTPGVYYFYGEDGGLLYVGKSKHLRSRVNAHFSADHRSGKEMRLSQSVRSIEYRKTVGELGALLLENSEIKALAPIYNRRQRRYRSLWIWQLNIGEGGFLQPVLSNQPARGWTVCGDVYGPYRNRSTALKSLRRQLAEQQLCLRVLGLETGQGACFAHQLGQCRGACVGRESVAAHNLRLQLGFAEQKLSSWPYPGAVAIRESSADGAEHCFHLVHHWAYLGAARDWDELLALLRAAEEVSFDIETYRLLLKTLRHSDGRYEVLEVPAEIGSEASAHLSQIS